MSSVTASTARPEAIGGARTTPRTSAIVVLLFVMALVPLFTTPVLPFIDLYDHLARYFVLAHLDSSPLLRANYASNWAILPNIGLDVVGTALARVVPAAFAAHSIVGLIFAIDYAGVLYFNRALTGKTSPVVAVLLVPLLYSFVLNWGFANFLIGLGLVFFAAGWWLSQRHRLAVALPLAIVLAVIIFFTHGLCFALYGILVVMLEVGRWAQSADRRFTGLVRALVPVAAQAVIPVVLFALAATSASPDGATNAGRAVSRLMTHGELVPRLLTLIRYRLVTIVRVEEGPSLWFDTATLLLQIGIVAWLVARGRAAVARPAWPAIAVAALLVVIVPPAMFGVGYVADRMPLFLAMLVVGALGFEGRNAIAVAALVAIAVARLAAISFAWQSYAADFVEFTQLAPRIPRGSLVADLVVGGAPRDSDAHRCPVYSPQLVRLYGQVGPLFADTLKQPLRLTGRLAAAVAALPPGRASGDLRPAYYDDYVAHAGAAGFDYLIVCHIERLTRPLPAGVTTIAHARRFAILKLSPQS